MKDWTHTYIYKLLLITPLLPLCVLTGCIQKNSVPAILSTPSQPPLILTTEEEVKTPAAITYLEPDGILLPQLEDLPDLAENPIPDVIRIGEEHPVIASLQERLMELGFMDNDEPTQYYGTVTEGAVKIFQRQNELVQDGIVGSETLAAIMEADAKYYAVSKGVSGDDISRIQNRLYELGYLAEENQVNSNFGEDTEAAVVKLQEVNGLASDGKVGRQTINLLYSDEIKPNYLSYGEKSDIVLSCQKRLRELGYLVTEPDGAYGSDTALAVKQFQSRNDLIVDGYLGPSTRVILVSSEALPNGVSLGENGQNVEKIQQLLSKYGYLASANVTGYYGEVTQKAVKSFQANNGLSADGTVGKMTMNKLTGTDAKKASAGGGTSSGGSTKSSGVNTLLSVAKSKLGAPYVYGAKGSKSFDCSGFIYWCLNQSGVKQSYLTSAGWRNAGKYTKITKFSDLKAGDIIVVKGHVGIVAGGGQVIDASSSNGKVVQRSLNSWWSRNFICGWRIF